MLKRKSKDTAKRERQPQNVIQKTTYFHSKNTAQHRRSLLDTRPIVTKNRAQQSQLQKFITLLRPRSLSSAFTGFLIIAALSLIIYVSSVSTNSASVSRSELSYAFRGLSEYEQFINQYVSSNMLARNKLLFPVSDFNQAFITAYPEVTSIQTNVPIADRTIQVTIETPRPLFRVAGTSENGTFYYVDANGSIVTSDLTIAKNDIPQLSIDSSSLIESGSQLLTQNEVLIISLIKQEVNRQSIEGLPGDFKIKSADLDIANGRLEVGFTGADYVARFSTYSDARNQVGALKAIMTELYGNDGAEDALPKEYVDVRVYEKVFIR